MVAIPLLVTHAVLTSKTNDIVDGLAGGTCQISGTLHGAAFFAGLEVVERSPHSRPSWYIKLGLDATVVYPTTDLKLRNPYDFPVDVHAIIDKGTLVFELRGRGRAAGAARR